MINHEMPTIDRNAEEKKSVAKSVKERFPKSETVSRVALLSSLLMGAFFGATHETQSQDEVNKALRGSQDLSTLIAINTNETDDLIKATIGDGTSKTLHDSLPSSNINHILNNDSQDTTSNNSVQDSNEDTATEEGEQTQATKEVDSAPVQVVFPLETANVRADKTGTESRIIAKVNPTTELVIQETILNGDDPFHNGNTVWFKVTWLNDQGIDQEGFVHSGVVTPPKDREPQAVAAETPDDEAVEVATEAPAETPPAATEVPNTIEFDGTTFDLTPTPENENLVALTPVNMLIARDLFKALEEEGLSIFPAGNRFYVLLPSGLASQLFYENGDQEVVVAYGGGDEEIEYSWNVQNIQNNNLEQANGGEIPTGAFMLDLEGNPIYYGRHETMPALPQVILDRIESIRVNGENFPHQTFAGTSIKALDNWSFLVSVPDVETGEEGMVEPFYTDLQRIFVINSQGEVISDNDTSTSNPMYESIEDIPAGRDVIVHFFINDGSGNVHPRADASIRPQDMVDHPNVEDTPDEVDTRSMRYWAVSSIVIVVVEPDGKQT